MNPATFEPAVLPPRPFPIVKIRHLLGVNCLAKNAPIGTPDFDRHVSIQRCFVGNHGNFPVEAEAAKSFPVRLFAHVPGRISAGFNNEDKLRNGESKYPLIAIALQHGRCGEDKLGVGLGSDYRTENSRCTSKT